MEYPGYSIYPGDPSEEAIMADCDHVYRFVTSILGFQSKYVYLMGRSIGTGACCYLASEYPVGLAVLISPFTSIKDVVRHNYTSLVSTFVKERFNNLDRIKRMKGPVLFVHGKEDDLVPVEHSKELYSKDG